MISEHTSSKMNPFNVCYKTYEIINMLIKAMFINILPETIIVIYLNLLLIN